MFIKSLNININLAYNWFFSLTFYLWYLISIYLINWLSQGFIFILLQYFIIYFLFLVFFSFFLHRNVVSFFPGQSKTLSNLSFRCKLFSFPKHNSHCAGCVCWVFASATHSSAYSFPDVFDFYRARKELESKEYSRRLYCIFPYEILRELKKMRFFNQGKCRKARKNPVSLPLFFRMVSCRNWNKLWDLVAGLELSTSTVRK